MEGGEPGRSELSALRQGCTLTWKRKAAEGVERSKGRVDNLIRSFSVVCKVPAGIRNF